MTGRVLPADATGTLTFTVDGVPAKTVPLTPQNLGDLVSLGDSITHAGYIADPAQRYPAILAQSLKLASANYAAPGYIACQIMTDEILPNSVATQPATAPLYTLLIGSNDMYFFGTGSHETVFNNCHQATLAWLGITRTNKVLIGDSAVTPQSGVWTSAPAPNSCCINTLTNATGSGTLRFTLTTTGAPAYLWYGLQTASSGSFTVSIDGAPPSAYTQTLLVSVVPGLASSYGLLRLPVAAGTHTFDIAAQSGTVSVLAMGSAPILPGPTVLVGDIPNHLNDDPAATATYTADIQANIALLHADGLDLRFVPTQSYMFATPAEMMDQKHPNALGLSEIAAAFVAAVTPVSPAADTTSAATAAFITSNLPLGSHSIDIHYSGDSHYAPADAGTFTETIYDGSSTTALAADATTYSIQSPITLTAIVPQPTASGLVIFADQSGTVGSAWLNQPNLGEATLTLPSLPPGIHTITAQFQGDFQFNASVSKPVSINVAAAFTSTALTAPATRFVAATAVPLTATVTPASASGSIVFADSGISLGTSPLVAGAATLTTATLTPGTHNLTAAFTGNATLYPSQSPALTLEIDPSSSTVALAPLPASIPYGTPLPLSVTVSPATATGIVTIADGATTLGQPSLSNAVATLTATSLIPGTHTFNATYSGDANDLPSISSPVSIVVTRAASSLVFAPAQPAATFGTPIVFTATVTPSAATGIITVNDGGSTLTQLPIVNGSATFTSTTLAPGSHTLSATYSGDNFYGTATSAASTNITLIRSSVSLGPLPLTNALGNPLMLTATVSPTAAIGSVLFSDQTRGVLGQATVANGTASLTLPTPSLGPYSITASYSGDTHDTPATSSPFTTQVVLNPTITSLAASPSTAAFATPITLTATVTPAATGLVAFFDGSSLLGRALLSNGTAILTTTSLASGTHTLHAIYAGDPLNAGSTSGTIAVTITAQPTATIFSFAQNPITAAASLVCNIRVAALTSNPSGTITLRSSSNILATGFVGNPSGGFSYATVSFPATTLGLGTFSLVATYSGDPDHQPSSSSALPVTVTAIPTATILTLSSQQIPTQGSTILTAAVLAATPTPTGSIVFSSGGTILATVPLTAAGTASFTFSGNSIGSFPVTATYLPTGLYGASISTPQTVTVTPPLVAQLNPATITAAPGTKATASLTVTPLSGFSGPISATCKSAVSFVTCSLTAPTSLSAPTTIPIAVSVAHTVAALDLPSQPGSVVLAVALPFLILRKRGRACALVATLFCAALALNGCAEGGNFNSIPPGPQSVTITLTAAGISVPLALTVKISN